MKSGYNKLTYRMKSRLGLILFLFLLAGEIKAQIAAEMSSGLITDITGSISIASDGNWLNQGNLLPGTSTLILEGPFDQLLQQEYGSFHDVTINKSNGNVLLSGNINVEAGTLSIINQDLSLNGFIVTLDPTAMLSETPGNTVKGLTGYVTTARSLSSPSDDNIGGLGLGMISDDDFGMTEIRRGHAPQSSNGAEGILRYFDAFPEFNDGNTATLIFHYDESELNGNNEADLKMYRSPDGGVNWMEVPGVLNAVDNVYEATGVNSFSRLTLSSHCLETCMATVALTHPTDLYLNSSGLAYLQPEDVDNGSRGACGIESLNVLPEVFDCQELGPQNVVFTVRDNHGCEKTSNVVVNIIDSLPPVMQCRNITISIDNSCQQTIVPSEVDDGSADACGLELSLDITIFSCSDVGDHQVILTGTDPSGNTDQCIATVTVQMAPQEVVCQEATIDLGNLSAVDIDPLALVTGDPQNYSGYTFSVDPVTLYCDQLGDHTVTLTSTDPFGNISSCETVVHLTGPDADCDQVADQCDLCDGGDDRVDSDGDGIPDCADWDGWEYLDPDWQCGNNKVVVCHNGHEICINKNAVQAHLNQGDFLGPCDAANCDNVPAFVMGNVGYSSPDAGERLNIGLTEPDRNSLLVDTPDQILAENNPNPFFPETEIRFYLPVREWMTLSVLDNLGQPVAPLVQGVYEAGWHEITFDGSHSADGLYFYRIQTSQQSVIKTMVLVRQ